MKRRMFMVGLATIFAALTALSCGPYTMKSHVDPLQEKERIIVKDHALRRRLRLVKHAAERLPSGQLKVKMEIENKKEDTVHADIQFIFRDAQGFEIETTNWQPYLFNGHRVTLVEQNSLKPNAADYRVLIRKME